MRIGINPDKTKQSKNKLWKHRVVVVFYVPATDGYFSEMDQVLVKCLDSLVATINPETTCITLINNCSAPQIEEIVSRYSPHIDKYVRYSENKGKVYAVLNEVRGVFEEFVTIADSDILFYDGWEKAVFHVFENHRRAGAVSPHPCPYVSFYYNMSAFGTPTLRNNIRYGKYVSDQDIDLYLKGTNLPRLADRKNARFNWKQRQYIMEKPSPAVIGAYHVVATYRTVQFRNVYTFPKIRFRNSYEEKFIDYLANRSGLYRLSTIGNYIYHMGNTVDDVSNMHQNHGADMISRDDFSRIRPAAIESGFVRAIKYNLGRIFTKFLWNR